MKFKKLKTELPENQVTLLLTRTAPVRDKSTDAPNCVTISLAALAASPIPVPPF